MNVLFGVLHRTSVNICSLRRPVLTVTCHMAGRCSTRRWVSKDSSVLKHLLFKIKSTGPISVAEYMREVLSNPFKGYYVHQDMIGEDGDFMTSPEISQIFGELLAVWCISEWMAAGRPKTLQLVELGPGRGTLAEDILRVFKQFQPLLNDCDISLHMVEISHKLSDIQALKLTGENLPSDHNKISYKKGTTRTGLPISWYQVLADVPRGFSLYLAHEFFDALAIHIFRKTERGWAEVLIAEDPSVSNMLCFVLSPTATLAAKTLIHAEETRDHVEVCPDAAVIVQELASRIDADGGAALIADYGHDGDKTDTFRGFRDHKLHDVLIDPGSADLTADVDFSYLRRMLQGKVASLGPISQQEFLTNMGIDIRLQALLVNSKDSATKKELLSGYDMLVNPHKMGERFKFFALLPEERLFPSVKQAKTDKSKPAPLPVAGFSKL
ncbi:protein arginine methyltransferase NDUFAF7, mitochondrial isoform X2 [Pleurodeles waltl]